MQEEEEWKEKEAGGGRGGEDNTIGGREGDEDEDEEEGKRLQLGQVKKGPCPELDLRATVLPSTTAFTLAPVIMTPWAESTRYSRTKLLQIIFPFLSKLFSVRVQHLP